MLTAVVTSRYRRVQVLSALSMQKQQLLSMLGVPYSCRFASSLGVRFPAGTLRCVPVCVQHIGSFESSPVPRERLPRRLLHAHDGYRGLSQIFSFVSAPVVVDDDHRLLLGDTLGAYCVRCACKLTLFHSIECMGGTRCCV